MLYYQLSFLCFTLVTLIFYLKAHTNAKGHRLLPVLLCLIALYNFYQVIECVTNVGNALRLLQDLLMVQVLYLVIHYLTEFNQVRKIRALQIILNTSIVVFDISIIISYQKNRYYSFFLLVALLFYYFVIISMAVYTRKKYVARRMERRMNNLLYVVFLIPMVGYALSFYNETLGNIVMPLALSVSCCNVIYLLQTGYMTEVTTLLQERMYNSSDVATILVDADFFFLDANAAAREMFAEEIGLHSRESALSLTHPWIVELTKDPEKFKEVEYRGRFFRLLLMPEIFQKRLRGYILQVTDITALKNETLEMEKQKEEASQLAQAKSDFLARMSHDLRSPLHAIMGVSDILIAKKELSGRNRALVESIKRAGVGLLSLVNGILDFSKLEAGKLELTVARYNIEELVQELTRQCVINLQSKDVDVSSTFLNEHPKYVLGDEMRVREVIQNLLSNAVKYTKRGEIRCNITCSTDDDERVKFVVTVSDTGSGMTMKQRQEVFGEYVTYSGNHSQEGTGLGLAIVKQLCMAMGGNAYVSSAETNGTTFTVSFYQQLAERSMCPPIAYTKESILRRSLAWNQDMKPNYIYPEARVLVADDMKINLEIFKELAQDWKFKIDAVIDGKTALEMSRRHEYDMIVLDHMMPELSGIEVAEQMRQQGIKVPIILLSANLSDETRVKSLQKGVTEFLAKPIYIPVFQKVIEEYMDVRLRQSPETDMGRMMLEGGGGRLQRYCKTLEAFATEMRPLLEVLPEYNKDDQDMFRIKVHGIKGASRQIGRLALSERAEVLEMASKTRNLSFIDRHLGDFLSHLAETVEEVMQELERVTFLEEENQQDDAGENGHLDMPASSYEAFCRLRVGFNAYDIEIIEQMLECLRTLELSEKEKELVERAKDAYYELEYEQGSDLLKDYNG